ncbi:MAG: adenosylcobinamide-phosphate synthase CbiB [Candidatus Tectimicrobiota bacterium]
MTLLLALLYDLWWGDPPNRLHPVAWMGQGIALARRLAPHGGRALPCLYGALLVLGGALLAAGLGTLLVEALRALPRPVAWCIEAWVLKTTFALRGLALAAQQVQEALTSGDVVRARQLVAWHLVSRDTTHLTPSQVAAATVESVAENASDSLIAPLMYYTLGGLPAALAYRFINTADAMLGYRDAEREWLGKVPARLDDLANLLPARLTALFLLLATRLLGGPAWRVWWIWRRDASQTASPNAGRPMSAMAGALGIELEKVGHYCLGAGQALPGAQDITSALRLVYGVALLAVLLSVLVESVRLLW